MNDITYTYKQKPLPAILGILFFAICSYVLAMKANTNNRGLILNQILEFSPSGATNFYWTLTILSGILSALSVYLLIQSISNSSTVQLTQHSIITPTNGLKSKYIEIPYSSIKGLQVQSVHKQKFLHILHTGGKHSLIQARFKNKEEFENLLSNISMRVKH